MSFNVCSDGITKASYSSGNVNIITDPFGNVYAATTKSDSGDVDGFYYSALRDVIVGKRNYSAYNMPKIEEVIIQDPAVVVKWSDNTLTVGRAMDGEEFNPEVGFAMAISRKYFENLYNIAFPRSVFKSYIKNAKVIKPKKVKNKKNTVVDDKDEKKDEKDSENGELKVIDLSQATIL